MNVVKRSFARPFRPVLSGLAVVALLAACDSAPTAPADDAAADPSAELHRGHPQPPGPPTLLTKGLAGALGSAVGPGGQLYVTEGTTGTVSRVNRRTGQLTPIVTGLPPSIIGSGGAVDVAFLGRTAYVLVTLVDDPILFPTGQVNGIYRVDGPNSATPIADIGAFNVAHPPTGFDFFVSTGVLYALTPYWGGFLVTDGHLNRVLRVTRRGEISIVRSFGNVVPTGIDISGNHVLMAEAGPVPHSLADGKIVTFGRWSSGAIEIATGCQLCVDVERGREGVLFGLAQGVFGGGDPGAPAKANTGSLLRVDRDGSVSTIADGLNQPTSMELIGDTAYIISLAGEIWTIDNVQGRSKDWGRGWGHGWGH